MSNRNLISIMNQLRVLSDDDYEALTKHVSNSTDLEDNEEDDYEEEEYENDNNVNDDYDDEEYDEEYD